MATAPETASEATPEAGARMTTPDTAIVDTALSRGHVSFPMVAHVYYWTHPRPWGFGDAGEEPRRKYYPKVVEAFEQQHGDVRDSFYLPRGIPAAGAITENDEIHLAFPHEALRDEPLGELIVEADQLGNDAARLLEGPDRRRVANQIFSVCGYLLGVLPKSARGDTRDLEPERRMARHLIERAKAALDDALQRTAQFKYFEGMLLGTALSVCLVLLMTVLNEAVGLPIARPGAILTVLLMGATGAAISVMYRMSFGGIVLDALAGRRELFRIGMIRPVIGATFALAVYFLLDSGILRVELPDQDDQRLSFVAAVSFLAGFSERWAQDMLVVAQGRVKVKDDDSSTDLESGQGVARPA